MSEIAIALIGAAASICASIITVIAVVVTSNKNNAAMDAKLDKQQAVMETKLEDLTREVREHNNFAKRMPAVEKDIENINRRLTFLEGRLNNG